MFTSLSSLTIIPEGVYYAIYPSLRGNIEEFDFSMLIIEFPSNEPYFLVHH